MRDFILKLTTLAAGEALSVLVCNWDYIGGANSFTGLAPHTGLLTCVIVAAISLYVAWRFDGARLGFPARAVRGDPRAARPTGLFLSQGGVYCFCLCTALIRLVRGR